MIAVLDPIASGLVTSLARPAGNVTGLTLLEPELILKRFELIHETSPRAKQVAFLVNPSNPGHAAVFKVAEVAARSLKMGLQRYDGKNLDEIKSAFATMTKTSVGAVVVPPDTVFAANHAVIAILAEQERLPSFETVSFAEAGGLIGLGVN